MSLSICSTQGANTGGIDCEKKKGAPAKMLVGSSEFSSTNWATSAAMFTALLSKINQKAGTSDKLFPFPTIQGTTPGTEADTEGNLGYGLKIRLREGRPQYTFQVLCGSTQFKALRAFNNLRTKVFVMDEDGAIWGTKNSSGKFVGYKCLINVSGNGFEDKNSVETKVATVTISIESAAEFNENDFYFEATSFTEADLEGLKDAPLAASGAVSGTTKIEILIPTASLGLDVNLWDFFKTELASTSLWEAFTGTGYTTPLTITGVTANSDPDKTWSVVFDGTEYGALASSATIKLNLKDPATLYAAGVTGVEGIYVILTKP